MIELNVTHTKIAASNLCTIVEGNVNSIFIKFSFSAEWDNLARIAVFANGRINISVFLTSDICAIPWEVLDNSGDLNIAIKGIGNSGDLILCTENAYLGKIQPSNANRETVSAVDATPSVIDTLIASTGNLADLTTTSRNLVSAINEISQRSGGTFTPAEKASLLSNFAHVLWADEHGQEYYDALAEALGTTKSLVSISAVFTQGATVVYPSTSLDSLKASLVIVATYDDESTETINANDYNLSGTLTEGTSTITATYKGKTATFTVTVTAAPVIPVLDSISAVYSGGDVEEGTAVDTLKANLVVTAHYTDSSTQTVASGNYTLTGTIALGINTITVSYEGKTTTFTVTGTEQPQSDVLYSAQNVSAAGAFIETGAAVWGNDIANHSVEMSISFDMNDFANGNDIYNDCHNVGSDYGVRWYQQVFSGSNLMGLNNGMAGVTISASGVLTYKLAFTVENATGALRLATTGKSTVRSATISRYASNRTAKIGKFIGTINEITIRSSALTDEEMLAYING